MLKSELIRPRIKTGGNRVWTQPLSADYHFLDVASELLAIFRQQVGHSRGELNAALRDYEGDSLEYPIIRGLAAVIAGFCTFGSDPPIDPVVLRTALFARGPVTQRADLFNQTRRDDLVTETAVGYSLSVPAVEAALFADLVEEQILLEASDLPPPGELILRYNLELARGLLYWAREMRLAVKDNYKDVFKYIKLFKLMHLVQPLETNRPEAGYQITLFGPISPFVKSTIRYGLQFAKFLPALLLCDHWRMEADIKLPWIDKAWRYVLNDQMELRTHFKSSGLFDSRLEADFAAEFEEKYDKAKRKWHLAREDELIVVGDSVLIPDFSITHQKDGRRALIEIVGFWHPTYLRRKLEKVEQAGRRDLILLVFESANVAEGTFEAVSAGEVLRFSRKPVLKEVLAAVERVAVVPE